MRVLPSPLRKQLETAVLAGRRAAEAAARAAIEGLGVFAERRLDHLDVEQAALRNGLRAKWRQLGNDKELLVGECAYEQWHRLLFARFLAENDLLLHPTYRAPVTLEDCEELAGELGEPDGWSVAARFAAEILPGIFRLDDPCVRLRLAPEGRHALEQVIAGLPAEVFAADDALGWVYQFWQKDKKDEVNASERKIGGADLGPVTQLFTENYMVRFLLENSLGAWWASRHPDSPLVSGFEYLRFDDDGKPAAGSFDSWPERVAEVTVMDPCCGSGHFLIEAFSMLWQMRVEEEGLDPVEAQDAVLRDNLFGLELDPRCVQIAMFAVALQAWKAGGGHRQLPVPNIACSGIPVNAPVDEWKKLAHGDQRLENALARLHVLFRDADTLGSLIEPRRAVEPADVPQSALEDVQWKEGAPLLATAAVKEGAADPATAVLGAGAASAALAADLLSRRYALVATNVPYLSRTKQDSKLANHCSEFFPQGTADLAVAFLLRLSTFVRAGGTYAAMFPEKVLNLGAYRRYREWTVGKQSWNVVAVLGPRGFSTPMFDFGIVMALISNVAPESETRAATINVSKGPGPVEKACALREGALSSVPQRSHMQNPDSRFLLKPLGSGPLLSAFADSTQGICTGDYARFGRVFWEIPEIDGPWEKQQSTVSSVVSWGGREHVLFWQGGKGDLLREVSERLGPGGVGAWIRGVDFLNRQGVVISQTGRLRATLFSGELLDNNAAAIAPFAPSDLPALWAFVSSEEYHDAVRAIDTALKVTNQTLLKVPFDVERWRRVADEEGLLPEPWSDDPTQWLFGGRPEMSTAPLQVAVARLLGYRWPEQAESDGLDALVDGDGIVCLPSVAGEPLAADRVQHLLLAAFDESWSPEKQKELLEQAPSKKSLADWLRDEFFKQHCALFGNRPFIWHVWDGQRDGFAALLNYHRLDRKALEKLTYTYLGQDWVERQRAAVRDEVAGAEARLAAALELQRKLEAILKGEAADDIYVRWKQLLEQPLGWEPDLNDGVRLNIRPFVKAGVLRAPFNIHWKKDRGKNSDGSERHNDIHLSLAEKLEARRKAGRA